MSSGHNLSLLDSFCFHRPSSGTALSSRRCLRLLGLLLRLLLSCGLEVVNCPHGSAQWRASLVGVVSAAHLCRPSRVRRRRRSMHTLAVASSAIECVGSVSSDRPRGHPLEKGQWQTSFVGAHTVRDKTREGVHLSLGNGGHVGGCSGVAGPRAHFLWQVC